MSLIVLERASLSFGAKRILDGASLRVGEGERIGLVGPNGSGKSTLLRILMGSQALDTGKRHLARGCRIGYLPQDLAEVVSGTLLRSVLGTVLDKKELQDRLARIQQQLEQTSDPGVQMKLATRQADLLDRLEHFDRYYGEHRAMVILGGLGFSERDLERPFDELSGGWRMRAALAGLLFQQPDVLFLDEPTNHLDLPSVLWLNQFLAGWRSALLLISHDRQFFNRHVERVLALSPEGLRAYSGNYDHYLQQHAAEQEVLLAQARNRERRARELERFVERFKAKASKARQAQSKAKLIEKLQAEVQPAFVAPRPMRFSFPPSEHTGRDVLLLQGVSKSFGDRVLYRDLTRTVYAGDRVAIIGANGTGKTTLLKLMAGELAADEGQIRLGANVKPGYVAQHHTELLVPSRTVLQEVRAVAPTAQESHLRGICGLMLFSGDEVDKPTSVLSGGERARVLLARLLARPGNLLLLDEPTTHLDVSAAEVLGEALAGFDGTMVFVSHNTSLLDRLATKIWEIADRDIIEHQGNFSDYLQRLAPAGPTEGPLIPSSVSLQETALAGSSPAAGETRQQRQARKRQEAERRNILGRRTRVLRESIVALEKEIAELEAEQQELEPRLSDPELYTEKERSLKLLARHNDIRRSLEQRMARWEREQTELAQVMAEEPDE